MVVGVPEIAPLVDESDNPFGSEGEIDHEVTVPATVGVTVDMAMFCVKSKTFGEYEMAGAERPPVIIGSCVGDSNAACPSSPNHVKGFSTAKLEKSNSSETSSEATGERETSMIPAEIDMVIIKITKNTDLRVFFVDARDRAGWPMIKLTESIF